MLQLEREGSGGGRAVLLGVLDLAIVLTAGAAALYLVVGAIRTPIFSVSGFAKPFLQTFILASLRAGVGGTSWLPTLLSRMAQGARDRRGRMEGTNEWIPAALDAAVALVCTRLAAKAVGFAANLTHPEFVPRSFRMPFDALEFAETFAAWDSAWYVDIAQHGYAFRPDSQSNIAFFPLYPLLMRLIASAFGGHERAIWVSGVVISYVSFFVALMVLHRLTQRVAGTREAARRAVLYLAVFPFSFTFTRVYTESLFLAVSVGAVWCATTGKWGRAGGLGALAALARPNGILIGVPLALLVLHPLSGHVSWSRRLAGLAVVPLGLAAYCAYAFVLSGDPLAWLAAQEHWGYSLGHRPWATVQRMFETIEARGLYGYLAGPDSGFYSLSHAIVGIVVVAVTPRIFRHVGTPFGAYVAVSILVPFTSNALEGIGRYAATMFPIFMYLGAAVESRRTHEAMLIVGSMWLALNIGLFVTQHPVY